MLKIINCQFWWTNSVSFLEGRRFGRYFYLLAVNPGFFAFVSDLIAAVLVVFVEAVTLAVFFELVDDALKFLNSF